MNESLQNLPNDILTLRNLILQRAQQHFKNEVSPEIQSNNFYFWFCPKFTAQR